MQMRDSDGNARTDCSAARFLRNQKLELLRSDPASRRNRQKAQSFAIGALMPRGDPNAGLGTEVRAISALIDRWTALQPDVTLRFFTTRVGDSSFFNLRSIHFDPVARQLQEPRRRATPRALHDRR